MCVILNDVYVTKLRPIAAILLLTFPIIALGQATNPEEPSGKTRYVNFYLSYAASGLGSNLGQMMPTFKLKETKFTYSYEQNSYFGKRDKKPKRITKGTFKTSSIDSIINIVALFKDTTIVNSNPCIMSGVIHFLTISNGVDTIRYELMNTFDWTALKVVDIINSYLPTDKKLSPSAELIRQADECWEDMKKRIDAKGNQ